MVDTPTSGTVNSRTQSAKVAKVRVKLKKKKNTGQNSSS